MKATSPVRQAGLDLVYYFCRLQWPALHLSREVFQQHLQRTFDLGRNKTQPPITWETYLAQLYPLDWYLAAACLDGQALAWEYLFAARAGRSDFLLLDALRARAARLYPRDEERQESAITEFWSQLYVSERDDSLPILARYDGLRPLVPWLIRVFQNLHISLLRRQSGVQSLPEDEMTLPLPPKTENRWHESFCQAARQWIGTLQDMELLILGMRLRYRLSQREVTALVDMHEGTVSRRTDQLRERCLEFIAKQLVEEGWTGDDLFEYVRTEMAGLLLDDPRLSADNLANLLRKMGKNPKALPLPVERGQEAQ